MKIYVSAEYRTRDPLILAGRLDRLAIEADDYLCFKLLHYSEVAGNAWGVSNHVAIQIIKVLKFKCKQ